MKQPTHEQEKILNAISTYYPYAEIAMKLQGSNNVICEFINTNITELWSYNEEKNTYYIESNEVRHNIEVVTKTELKLCCEFNYIKLDEIANALSYLKRSEIIDKKCLEQIIKAMVNKNEIFFKTNKYEPTDLADEYPEINKLIEELLFLPF